MRSAWETAADLIDPQVIGYANDPIGWAQDNEVALWSKQREILASIVEHDQTAVHSCHNAGKSFTAALAAAWWISAHPPGTAFVMTTAPTDDQVKVILWRELNRQHRRLDLPGRINLKEWYIGDEIVAMGRKPNDYDPTSFQGVHAIFVLVILDEASGIPLTLWEAASSLVSNDTSRTLAIGNPDDPTSEFARKCKPGSGWHTVHIGADDCPNFSGEPVAPVISQSTLSQGWVNARRLEYGEDSPFYVSRILGLFPSDAEDGVVPWSWATACQLLETRPGEPVILGVDVGAGGDQSVIRERRGEVAGRVWRSRHDDPERLCNEIVHAVLETGAVEVRIDSNGIGWGVAGMLNDRRREGIHNARVEPINVSTAPSEPKKFENLRAEMWWMVGRERSRVKAWDLGAVDDACMAELTTPKYKLNKTGKIVIEPKDEVRKRLGRSPDDADALLLAFLETHSVVESYGEAVVKARLPGVRSRR